ncbi:hypothetical protein [Paramagnetospirillum magneticum]|uniref:Uncharacterized protein n=1 Tax=Paramagnetospirillum magneticum (strain ATCC 700264 / AMB-1) TaxID=342108 RepID=Q2W595_PARM1|nr:hypothetical protein [Paramagnetospirillum magneticum]BAE50980.1 hypothetical protein amb2176 [Paramagnetospirillum magneticum AMB-1]
MATSSATHSKPFIQTPVPRKPVRRSGGGGKAKLLALGGIALVVAALGSAALLMRPHTGGSGLAATPEAFAEQMEAAARAGGGTVPHVFGGTIRAERNGAVLALVADNVPPSACVSVGWKLVRKGLLSINGTMPLRVSAAKLSDLCNQEDGNAVLTWIPKLPE